MPNRIPLTEQYQRAQGMVTYVQENLSAEEYALFLDLVAPLPEPETVSTKKPQKKSAKATTREYDHCLRCGTTKRDSSHKDQSSPDYHEFQSSKPKSARASKMESQLKSRVSEQREATSTAIDDMAMEIVERCSDCEAPSDDNVHHKQTDLNYHPFVSESDVQPVASSSSSSATPARDDSYGVNSGIRQDAATVVAGGSNERV
jgi:hypothetical protein